MSSANIDAQHIFTMIVIIIVIALLVAIFFASKHHYEQSHQVNVRHGKMHFFFMGKVRYKRYQLSGVNMKVWNQNDDEPLNLNPETYDELKKRFSFSQHQLQFLTNPQIEELSRCLVQFPNVSYDAIFEDKNIKEFRSLQNELERFIKVIKQRQAENQFQHNYFNEGREKQLVDVQKRYKLNRKNLDTLSEKEANELRDYVNTYLGLVNSINYNSDSIVVLGSITQQLENYKDMMIKRAKKTEEEQSLEK